MSISTMFIFIYLLALIVLLGVGGFMICLFSVDWLISLFMSLNFVNSIFIIILFLISMTTIFFSNQYIGSELSLKIFRLFLIMFIISMFMLIFGKDFFLKFFGWEGLGISSFVLIFYFSSSYAGSSAMKTVVVNRIGDSFFLIFLGGFLFSNFSGGILLVVVFCFCFCKSAIFPFFSWLPSAMAAPTPISALVHTSTLVTAGVWVLMELNIGGVVLAVFGAITMVVGGFMALIESDMKKVVAFSTMSQIGLILFSLFMNGVEVSFFHLCAHGFFKSVLFMMVGLAIMFNYHSQQLNQLSVPLSSFVRLCFATTIFSMSGVIFFSGGLTKHMVIGGLCGDMVSIVSSFFMCFGFLLTGLYCGRMIFISFGSGKLTFSSGLTKVLLLLFVSSVLVGKWGFDNLLTSFKMNVVFLWFSVGLLFWWMLNQLLYFNSGVSIYSNTVFSVLFIMMLNVFVFSYFELDMVISRSFMIFSLKPKIATSYMLIMLFLFGFCLL